MAYVPNSVGEQEWDDFLVPGFALGTGNAAPALTAFTPITNMQLYGFNGTPTPDELFGVIELLHGWKEGTDIWPHVHWTPNDANSGNVLWQMTYSIKDENGVFQNGVTLTALQPASGVNVEETIEFNAPIPGANLKIGDQIPFRLFRDSQASQDNYAGLAKLLTVGFHYQKDTLGSRQRFSK